MDKQRANFCDWFQPRPGAFVAPRAEAGKSARGDLERLFGGDREAPAGEAGPAAARTALDDLFKKPPG
jgi:hypothetical protein